MDVLPEQAAGAEYFPANAPVAVGQEYTLGVFHHLNEAIVITDGRNRIIDVNPAFVALTGFQREEVIGESPDVFSVRCLSNLGPDQSAQPQHGRDSYREELNYRDKRGMVYPAMLSASRIRAADGQLSHHIIVLVDLSGLASRAHKLSREVYFDALTGLPNLQLLTQLIQESMEHARRTASSLLVCVLDIDHFKVINDRIGRTSGDVLLASLSRRIGQLLSGDDVLSRVGGDEFVLLLHRELEEAFLLELLEAIYRPLLIEGQQLRVSVSMGIAIYPSDNVDGDVLLRHANQAMYLAKQQGRNTYHIFDPLNDQQLQRRQEQRQRFAEALVNNELRLHYQPQLNMTCGKIIGVEALVRWQHPELGLLAPGLFLPVIEGSGLEVALGEWGLEQALIQLQQWQQEGIMLPVHVNISPAHLLTIDFIDRLLYLLERYPQVPAHMLKLEVLETAAMHDIDAALSAIHRCQALGIDIAIDDFGTGYSSLTHLRQLPVNLIKIDQSFVRDMLTDKDDMAIVESVIYMANRFDRPMLAEGVETLEHARALAALGCRLVQGYGIARPMPPCQLPAWLTQWPGRKDWAALVSMDDTDAGCSGCFGLDQCLSTAPGSRQARIAPLTGLADAGGRTVGAIGS
ncbi:hypothetical protein GCM10022394_19990 [Zobellella aerophila]|uniref:Diguanylate cyclase n=2 Tax=Zobellella aerophila TaxID=870480 RepID=A0ABP6VWF3_9GAMM